MTADCQHSACFSGKHVGSPPDVIDHGIGKRANQDQVGPGPGSWKQIFQLESKNLLLYVC